MKIRKKKSREATVENARRLFANSEGDEVSIKDAFIAWGRPNPEDMETNKMWLSNILYHLKFYDLIRPVYAFDSGRKKIVRLRLQKEGKRALGRIDNSDSDNQKSSRLESTMKMIAKLKEENPEFEINFEMKLKSE